MKKRILSMLLAIVMVVGLVPGFTITASAATEITPSRPAGGDGSEGNPYQITTAAELYWFADFVNSDNANACGKLMNDITVNENVIVDGALNSDTGNFVAWTPIGVRVEASTKVFSGTFDGGNHTIRGLYVAATSGYQGLIGFMESGTVKNVTVADSYFSGTTNIGAVVGCYGQTGAASIVTNCHNVNSVVIASDYYVGGIVGGQYAPATSHAQIVLSDCSNSGSVTGAQYYVGGIIGYAEYFSEGTAISNCTNTGTITCTSTNRAQGTGGIAGYFGGSSAAKVEIVGCTNSGTIQITEGGKQDYMGGIVGRNYYGHISDCNNTGTISGYQFVGGIVGTNSGTVTNCRNTGTVIATGSAIGGIAGTSTNSGAVTGCTNSAAVQGNYYVGGIIGSGIGSGLSGCTNTGNVTATTYGAGGVIGYVDSTGTVENCHNEGDVKGTRYIGGLVGYHYSGKVNYTECSNKGNVEGSSYDIGGLFGRITDSSVVTRCYNTGNVTCTGTYSTSWDYGVGGLAGATFNAAIFENCYNTGAVNGGSNQNIGGLVGFFTYASGSTEHYIKNSHNTGSVTGGKNTGGLFGSYEAKGVSENCYNTGIVTGESNTGGLVGYHKSTGSGIGAIKNCYNIGSVSGSSYVGGLLGYSFYNNCLETSYNVGTVSGTSNIGGVIGNSSNNKSVTNCYYLDTCVTNDKTVTGATALTAQQMTDDTNWQTNFAGFDTTTPVWSKKNNENTAKYLPKLDSYSPTLHVHGWTYSADGTTITATCNVNGCPDTNGGTVTISAPTDLFYSGFSKDAACSYSNWQPDSEETIVYNTVDRINVTGEVITASITIGEATASVSYQITPRVITTSMVTLSPSSTTYDGSEKTITVTVKYSSTTLTDGTDYEFTGTTSATEPSTGSGYTVTVTGKGNFTGEVTKYWKIKKIPLSPTIAIEDWTYGDSPKVPSVTENPENGEVTYTYYTSYGRRAVKTGEANGADAEGGVPKYAGTYYVGASIAETEHYQQKTISPSDDTKFVISPREVSEPTFEGLQETYPYDDGNEIKPTFTLKDDLGNVIPASEYTVTYSNNTDAGKATITITDATEGNYIVSGSEKFKIVTHSHSWSYRVNAAKDTITASCIANGCPNTNGGSVTIVAPTGTNYTGTSIEATMVNTLTTGVTPTIVYTAAAGSALTDGYPVKIGTYTATITVGEGENAASVSVTYTIEHSNHDLGYTDNGNGTHTEFCACGYSASMPHTYNDHRCACTDVEQFTVTYTDGVEDAEIFQDVVESVDYNAATPSFGANDPTRTGYSFTGWSPSVASAVTENATYTAQWTAHTYTVQFNANGGSGTMADMSFTYNALQNLSANQFTYAGKNFIGWNTVADGSGTAYTNEQSVGNLTAENNGIVTLYAQWSDKEAQTITLDTSDRNATYGDGTLAAREITASGAITYSSSNKSVATVDENGVITVLNVGETIITATAAETAEYASASVSYQLIVAPKTLTITAEDKEAYVGSEQPELTYTVDGLVEGDTLTTVPALTTDGNMDRVGTYAIIPSGADAGDNYAITYVDGTLTVKSHPAILVTPTYPPIVDNGENGDVAITPTNPKEGNTVTITPDPDSGYEVDEIIVTDENGNPVTVIDNGDGTYSFQQPSGKVNIEVSFKEIAEVCPGDNTCPMHGYTDLDMGAWYHDGVHYCIEHGLMHGIGNNQFNPCGTTTRAMIVTILWRLEGEPVVDYTMSFTDVADGNWYTEAIRWAASVGITNGYGDGKFGTNDAITREQMVTIMFRYAEHKGYDISAGENTNILSYDDAHDVAEWAIPAMQWACGSGLVQGIADGDQMNLAPESSATRAQAAVILQRYCENVAKD